MCNIRSKYYKVNNSGPGEKICKRELNMRSLAQPCPNCLNVDPNQNFKGSAVCVCSKNMRIYFNFYL